MDGKNLKQEGDAFAKKTLGALSQQRKDIHERKPSEEELSEHERLSNVRRGACRKTPIDEASTAQDEDEPHLRRVAGRHQGLSLGFFWERSLTEASPRVAWQKTRRTPRSLMSVCESSTSNKAISGALSMSLQWPWLRRGKPNLTTRNSQCPSSGRTCYW